MQNVIQYPVYTVVRSAAVCKKQALSRSGTEKGLGRFHYISGLSTLLSSIIFFTFSFSSLHFFLPLSSSLSHSSLCTSFFHYLLHFLILLSTLLSSIIFFTFSFFSLHFFLPLPSSLPHSSLYTTFFHYLLHFLILLSALLSSIIFFTSSFFCFPACISFLDVVCLLPFLLLSNRPHV